MSNVHVGVGVGVGVTVGVGVLVAVGVAVGVDVTVGVGVGIGKICVSEIEQARSVLYNIIVVASFGTNTETPSINSLYVKPVAGSELEYKLA